MKPSTSKANVLLWAKHSSFALILALRADYVYGLAIAITWFVLFTMTLWGLFSYSRQTWVIAEAEYTPRETIILKSLLFSLCVLLYYVGMQMGLGSALFNAVCCHLIFSRLYRGNWEFFRTKPHSDTYRTLKKLLNSR